MVKKWNLNLKGFDDVIESFDDELEPKYTEKDMQVVFHDVLDKINKEYVDKDRIKAGRYAIKRFNADVLVLDDGFQYFKLRPSLSFVLVDKTNPFGNKSLIPRGILREPISHLNRASCIVVTKSDGHIPDKLKKIRINNILNNTTKEYRRTYRKFRK